MSDQTPQRASRFQQQPKPAAPQHPLGTAIGLLLAGAWLLFFAQWMSMPAWVSGIGGVSIFFGLIFVGIAVSGALARRAR